MPSVLLENVCKSYNANGYTVKAVNHVTLSIADNETIAIIGPSGSGKSTLLNMMGLILKPDDGRILIDGQLVTELSDSKCSMLRNMFFGYVVQDFALLDGETVYNNIWIPLLYSKNIKRREHKQRIKAAAESLGIGDKLNRNVAKLSGGERQRVAIARAIVCDQPIILADEPTGALDADNKERVMDILMKLCKERGKTLIIVTHDLSVAEKCGMVVQMHNGNITVQSRLTYCNLYSRLRKSR